MLRIGRDESGGVEDGPERGEAAKACSPNRVEEIVDCDEDQAEGSDDSNRQTNKRRQHNHRPTQSPDDYQQSNVIVEVELHDEATENDYFEKDKPEAARKEELR